MDPRIRQQARSDANRKRGCPTRAGQPLFRFLPPPSGTSAEPASPFPQRLPGILFRFIGASRNNGTSSFSVEDAGCKITGPKRDTAPSCDRAGTPFQFRPRTVRPGGKRRLHRNPAIRTVSTGRAQSRTSVRPPPNRETGEKRLRQADLARRLPGREADERNSGVLPPPERSLLRKHRAVRRIGRFGSAACCRRNFPRAHRIDCPRFSLSLRAAARINPIRPVRTHRGRFSFASFLLIGLRII